MRHQKDNMYGSFFRPFGNVSKLHQRLQSSLLHSWAPGDMARRHSWAPGADDPEICVTMTAPQLQEKESELKAMHQRLIHEAKEREKIEALLEQQKHFAAVSSGAAPRPRVRACVRAQSAVLAGRMRGCMCVCVYVRVRARSIARPGGEMNRLAGDAGERCGSECAGAGTQEKSRSRAHQCSAGAE